MVIRLNQLFICYIDHSLVGVDVNLGNLSYLFESTQFRGNILIEFMYDWVEISLYLRVSLTGPFVAEVGD